MQMDFFPLTDMSPQHAIKRITKARSVNAAVESELSMQVHPSPHALWRLFNRETDVLHLLSKSGWKVVGSP